MDFSELNFNSDNDEDELDEDWDEYWVDYCEETGDENTSSGDYTEYDNVNFVENHCEGETTQCENKLVCDTCDKDFLNMYSYQLHMKEHVVCSIDGCTFTAHEKIVAMHVKTQHSSGLYYKICNLSTPEDIKRWKDERKKKYPTKENIARRQEQQEEMLKRGEKLTAKSKFKKKDQLKFRSIKKKNVRPIKKSKPPPKSKSLIDEKSEWNGQMFPFRGTTDLYNTQEVATDNFEDTEWEEENREESHKEIVINNSLGALMCAYNSDNSDEEKIVPAEAISKIKSPSTMICDTGKSFSDNEAPSEEKISKVPLSLFEESGSQKQYKLKSAISSSGKEFNNKNKRKRTHNRKMKKPKPDNQPTKVHDNLTNRKFAKRRTTLLERLLASEIRHERNVLLQCVRHVVSNNYFES